MLAESTPLDLKETLDHFFEHGYARLGKIATDDELAELRTRADDLMLGRVTYDNLFFQLDTDSGEYRDLQFGLGYQGPSLNYRKVEKLEKDPLFRRWIQHPIFEQIAKAIYPGGVSVYRALLMTKAAETGGTYLPWHQDGGLFWGLDRDPTLQVWTALDDAPIEAGCVEAFPGSHKFGLARPVGGVVPPEIVNSTSAEKDAIHLPAKAGEVLLIHNYLWHRSGTNSTGKPRRAFTVCYMNDETRCLRKKRAPREFFRAFEK